jgi:hypothetical protein
MMVQVVNSEAPIIFVVIVRLGGVSGAGAAQQRCELTPCGWPNSQIWLNKNVRLEIKNAF